jgi:hypothetical protein
MSDLPPSMLAALRERWTAAQERMLTALESRHLAEPSAARQGMAEFNRSRLTKMTNALNAVDQAANLADLLEAEDQMDSLQVEMQAFNASPTIPLELKLRDHMDNDGEHEMDLVVESRGQVEDGRQQAHDELKRGVTEAWHTVQEAATDTWLDRYATLRLGPSIKKKLEPSAITGWDSVRDIQEARISMSFLYCLFE